MGRAQSRPDPFEPAMRTQLRIARPVTDLSATAAMYIQGLELEIIGEFNDHDGFDGIMLGTSAQDHHFEFTFCCIHPIQPSPTQEDLLVFYLPKAEEWEQRCALCSRPDSERFNRSIHTGPRVGVPLKTAMATGLSFKGLVGATKVLHSVSTRRVRACRIRP
jgi:hypothetical protein